jgi:hypothetical protein
MSGRGQDLSLWPRTAGVHTPIYHALNDRRKNKEFKNKKLELSRELLSDNNNKELLEKEAAQLLPESQK